MKRKLGLACILLLFKQNAEGFICSVSRKRTSRWLRLAAKDSNDQIRPFEETKVALGTSIPFGESEVASEINIDTALEKPIVWPFDPKAEETADVAETSILEQSKISVAVVAGLLSGTYVVSCVLADLLNNFEWFQNWRYFWPFGIGVLYVVDGFQDALKLFGQKQRVASVVLGIGLIIGGAYDAFMPVWMTGPNVVTAAGIGQDAAFGLFFLTIWQLCQSEAKGVKTVGDLLQKEVVSIFPQVLLLAELYKLGEGSFDEIFF